MGKPSRREANSRDTKSVISHVLVSLILIYISAQVLVVIASPQMPLLSYMLLALQHTLFIVSAVVIALLLLHAIERAMKTNESV